MTKDGERERKRLQITVPPNCGPGDRIDIVYAQDRTVPASEDLHFRFMALEEQRSQLRRRFQVTLWVWMINEMAAIILFVLTIALNVGATVNLSSACGVTDPISGAPRSKVFLNFFYGLTGNGEFCKNSSETFCLPWTSPNFLLFENLSGYATRESGGGTLISKNMFSAQVLIGLSLGFTVIASILHGLVITKAFSAEYGIFLASSYLLLIAFALSIAALSNIVTASAFISINWTQYFRSGATLSDLLEGTRPSAAAATAAPGEACYTSVNYLGGALLSAAIALLFVLMVWSLFSGCLAGPMVFKGHHQQQEEEGEERGQVAATGVASNSGSRAISI